MVISFFSLSLMTSYFLVFRLFIPQIGDSILGWHLSSQEIYFKFI